MTYIAIFGHGHHKRCPSHLDLSLRRCIYNAEDALLIGISSHSTFLAALWNARQLNIFLSQLHSLAVA